MRRFRAAPFVFFLLICAGCGASPTPPLPAATVAPTSVNIQPTPLQTVSPTIAPTSTIAPTPTVLPASTFAPQPMLLPTIATDGTDKQTWVQLNPKSQTADFQAVSCPTSQVCYAIGENYNSNVVKTDDGGQTWRKVLPNGEHNLFSLSCPDLHTCFVAGYDYEKSKSGAGYIYRTTDGGASWQALTLQTPLPILNIDCPNAQTCYAIQTDHNPKQSAIYRTADGGQTWTRRSLPFTDSNAAALSCPTIQICFVVSGGDGPTWKAGVDEIARTTDGAQTWSLQTFANPLPDPGPMPTCPASAVCDYAYDTLIPNPDLHSIACPTIADCYAVGRGVVVLTHDGGATWRVRSQTPDGGPQYRYSTTIACWSASTCVTIENDAPLVTTDSGQTWNERKITGRSLRALACPSDTRCIGVGDGGFVIASDNSGTTWRNLSGETGFGLSAIACPDLTTCYAAGVNGKILVTKDKGATWTVHATGLTAGFNAISCPNSTTCFAVAGSSGSKGYLAVTMDGGETWHNRMADDDNLTDIACPSPRFCLAVNEFSDGVIISDGGTSIKRHDFTFDVPYTIKLACADEKTCFIPLRAEGFVATFDGGATWIKEGQPPAWTMGTGGLACPTTTTCIALSAGKTYQTTNGGKQWTSMGQMPPGDVWGLACADARTCIAVARKAGKSGLWRTPDTGSHWTDITPPAPASISAVACPSVTVCYGVGANGLVMRYSPPNP